MSLNLGVIQVIEEVIEEKIENREIFTAFNVSVEVKNRGVNERHRNMKQEIHDCMDAIVFSSQASGSVPYKRTLVDVPGASYQVFLYHPDNEDISDWESVCWFDGNDSKKKKDNTSPTGARTSQQKNLSNKQGVKFFGFVSPDLRGRICIPVNAVREIKAETGDVTLVARDSINSEITLVKSGVKYVPSTHAKVNRLLVDKSGNVRLSRHLMKDAGLDNLDVQIGVKDNVIVISR